MTRFRVKADRSSTQPKIQTDGIEIPIGTNSPISKDNLRPLYRGNIEKVTPELRDFIEIASVINYADRYCLRGKRENWCRNIDIEIPLRNPQKFKEIKGDLELCLNILGGDNVSFNVIKMDEGIVDDIPPRERKRKKEDQKLLDRLTDIVLISGGQDSSIAAHEYLQNERVPYFVRINTHDKANPKDLLKKINKKRDPMLYLNQECKKLDGSAFNTESVNKETSQRLRSFYFLSVATSIAATTNISEININENGIMAIHLPLDVSRSSTFSTRTAYPPYLLLFSKIVQKWLGIVDFKVNNKWVLKTKNEVIVNGKRFQLEEVISDAISCAHAAKVQNTAKLHREKSSYLESNGEDLHCGYCFPCILRRISMTEADLEDKDVKYLMNPFGDMIVDAESAKFDFLQESKSAILSLIRFSKFFKEKPPANILISYPQIYECAIALGDIGSVSKIIELHKRFADEVYNFISKKSPLLSFLFDDEKSKEVDAVISSVATIERMETILDSFRIEDWNDHFEHELAMAYSLVRYRVLIALGNNLIDKTKLVLFFEEALGSILPHRIKRRKRKELNQRDGREVKKKILQDCNCPPMTGRRTG